MSRVNNTIGTVFATEADTSVTTGPAQPELLLSCFVAGRADRQLA